MTSAGKAAADKAAAEAGNKEAADKVAAAAGEESTTFEKTKCVDKNANCNTWRERGECKRNAAYMEKECAASCDMCHGAR
jgi:hypothetical protein